MRETAAAKMRRNERMKSLRAPSPGKLATWPSPVTLLLIGVMFVTSCLSARAAYVPVNFSAGFNRRLQDDTWGSIGMNPSLLSASGTTLANGVPFNIPVNGNNFWSSYQPGPGATGFNPLDNNQPRVLSIPVNISDAGRIYTLMDTYWGVGWPATNAKLEAFGTGGAYARIDLYGNVHFRDFNQNTFTNSVNQFPAGTQQVMTWFNWQGFAGPQRLDRQQFDLGNAFVGRTLTELRFTDSGGYNTNNPNQSQRIFVAGVTVETATTLTVTLTPPAAVGAGAQWRLDGGAWQNSGVKLGLSPGSHTVTYKTVTGWTEPASMPMVLASGEARNITATYTPAAGSVQVTLNPVSAVTAGAQWQVDGGPWQNSGDLLGGLSPGNHTVSFKTLSGWDAPPAQVTGITAGQTTGVAATYFAHPGSLQVTINPAGAVTAGAQWQVDGGPFQNSGATVASLTPGTHTVAFKTTALWNTPASQNVTVVSDQMATASGTYTQMTGGLQVTITPAGAVTAGAQWQVDGGAFQNSGATLTGITAGSHTLSFKTISGWATPAAQTVTINANATATASGTYAANPGSLQVTLSPAGAATAGAQWQVDGGAFQNSGATVSGLSAGSHAIVFKAVTGWITPANQSVTITSSNTTTATGTYTPGIGSLTVNIVPAGAITAGAQWRVDGGAFQNSGVTLTNLPSGAHIVSYKQLTDWGAPEDQKVDVPAGGTGQYTGIYTSKAGSLQVTLLPAGAVTAGAQWQVDGGALQNSGATVNALSPGSHTVSFKTISGWGTPVNQTVTVNTGTTTQATGTYTGAAGTLQVTLTPSGAVTAGAQWQLDGGPFQNSGTTLSNLTNGTHTITFKTVGQWNTPPPQTVTISTGNASTANGNYYPDCVAPGLVAWWKADGNGLDTLGANNLVLAGSPVFGLGAIDDAFLFDGVNDSAKVNASASLNVGSGNGFTLAAWIHPDVIGGNQAIMEWNGGSGVPGYGVHLYVGGSTSNADLYANLVSTTGAFNQIEAPGVILAGQWQHVALTWDAVAGQAVLYWNGVAVKQESFGSFTPQTAQDFYIGRRIYSSAGEPPFWFHGGMDSLQVYNRALTPSEMLISPACCDGGGTANFYITIRNPFHVYGYQINPQAAVLTRILRDPAHRYPYGLALSPEGEMFVGSIGNDQFVQTPAFVRRYGTPYTINEFTGEIGTGSLQTAHGLGFRGNELMVADSWNNRMRRYSFAANGDPVELPSITSGLINHAARGVLAKPDNSEVFITQCWCGGAGNIRRYRAETNGTFTDLGPLPGNPINPHVMAFSPWGEMFTANPDRIDGQSSNWFVIRHTFAADGTPQLNGTFNDSHCKAPISLVFSPWGELLVNSSIEPVISRFTFDANHQPVFRGSIRLPDIGGQMVFTSTFDQATLSPVDARMFSVPAQGSYRLEWPATPGRFYRIEYSSDLETWLPIPSLIQAGSTLESWIDPGPPVTNASPALIPRRFYRMFEAP